MINGVLVERTVKDVVPALKTNADGLKKVLDDLVKQYKTKQDDLEKWKVREEKKKRKKEKSRVPIQRDARVFYSQPGSLTHPLLYRRRTTSRSYNPEERPHHVS